MVESRLSHKKSATGGQGSEKGWHGDTLHYGEVVMGGGTFVSIRLCQLCLSFYQRPNISERFVDFSFSFYPCSNIPDTFVGDEMNGCQPEYKILQRNRKHGK